MIFMISFMLFWFLWFHLWFFMIFWRRENLATYASSLHKFRGCWPGAVWGWWSWAVWGRKSLSWASKNLVVKNRRATLRRQGSLIGLAGGTVSSSSSFASTRPAKVGLDCSASATVTPSSAKSLLGRSCPQQLSSASNRFVFSSYASTKLYIR